MEVANRRDEEIRDSGNMDTIKSHYVIDYVSEERRSRELKDGLHPLRQHNTELVVGMVRQQFKKHMNETDPEKIHYWWSLCSSWVFLNSRSLQLELRYEQLNTHKPQSPLLSKSIRLQHVSLLTKETQDEKVGLADKMSHISTGGGASLELLEKPHVGFDFSFVLFGFDHGQTSKRLVLSLYVHLKQNMIVVKQNMIVGT